MKYNFTTSFLVSYAAISFAFGVLGCDAESVDDEVTPINLGDEARGSFVLNNAYEGSISVSAVDTSAKVISEVLISSAVKDPNLNEAFSGDTVLSSADAFADELVLIDRSNAVLTWVGIETAKVRAQLDVGPGFDANPQDYLQISKNKAYVSRAAENGDAGKEKFDSGSDLLIVDPTTPKLLGSIDLRAAMDKEDNGLPPVPQGIAYAGGRVHVLLAGLAFDYSAIATARIVSIDAETDQIVQVLKLPPMTNCLSLSASPSGDQLAVSCTGFFGQDPAEGWPDSGLVVLDVKKELEENTRFKSDQFQHCVGKVCQNTQLNGVAFLTEELVILTTFGTIASGPMMDVTYSDQVVELSLAKGSTRVIHEAGPYDLGEPVCFAKACLVPDATLANPGVLKFDLEGQAFSSGKLRTVDKKTGMPPRQLQRF